jgi:two-component system C4-dicarboxylate transport sensor histidine kinase DctB
MGGDGRPSFYLRWVQLQNKAEHEGGEAPRDFLGAMAIAALLAVVAAVHSEQTGVNALQDFRSSMLALAPLAVHTAATLPIRRASKGRHRAPRVWLYSLGDSLFVLFWLAYMAVAHTGIVFDAFAVLFTANTAFYGFTYRSGGKAPMIILVSLLAAGAAMAVSPIHNMSTVAFGVVAATAAGMSYFAGNVAIAGDAHRNELAGLRAALHAQQLQEQVRETERLTDTLADILGIHHDAANTLTTAVLSAEALVDNCRASAADLPQGISRLAEHLSQDLDKVRELMTSSKTTGRTTLEPLPLDEVPLRPTIEDVVTATSRVYPGAAISVLDQGGHASVLVRGGTSHLRRIIENVVLNACQGDGERGASRIEIELRTEGRPPKTSITIRDDGPGFPQQVLDTPIEGFVTTKPHGTGVGIYTVDRLVRANGGSLRRINRPEGGAEVAFTLTAGPPRLKDAS